MELTWDEWVEKFKPLKDEYGNVYMYETYGEEYEFVKSQNPLCVWTLEDAGEGSFVMSGRHFANRIGYYITEIAFTEEDVYFISIEDDESDTDEEND